MNILCFLITKAIVPRYISICILYLIQIVFFLEKRKEGVFFRYIFCSFFGQGGIRTHGTCHTSVFKTETFNHSDTCPTVRRFARSYAEVGLEPTFFRL